ncbi:hypothetical protein GQX74_002497 [Glossina fuscipes]|nr:hypothetical protein GQX74_002497 [Glossina fuscipes]
MGKRPHVLSGRGFQLLLKKPSRLVSLQGDDDDDDDDDDDAPHHRMNRLPLLMVAFQQLHQKFRRVFSVVLPLFVKPVSRN